MKPSEGILKNINVLNFLLIAVTAIMFFSLAYPLFTTETKVHFPAMTKESVGQKKVTIADDLYLFSEYFVPSEKGFLQPLLPTKTTPENAAKLEDFAVKADKRTVLEKVPTGLDFIAVAEKNLFHPERRMPADKKGEQALVRPEIVFYGAIITSDKRIAYVEDKKNPYSTPGRGKRQTPLAEGAMIGGYKLKEINPESIVLVHGDDKMVVNLRDQKDRKSGEVTINAQMPQSGPIHVSPPVPRQTAKPGTIPPPLPPRPIINRK